MDYSYLMEVHSGAVKRLAILGDAIKNCCPDSGDLIQSGDDYYVVDRREFASEKVISLVKDYAIIADTVFSREVPNAV